MALSEKRRIALRERAKRLFAEGDSQYATGNMAAAEWRYAEANRIMIKLSAISREVYYGQLRKVGSGQTPATA
jgi:hypothetical protein